MKASENTIEMIAVGFVNIGINMIYVFVTPSYKVKQHSASESESERHSI